VVEPLARRLKLTNSERKDVAFLLEHEASVRAARRIPWPRLQRILIDDRAADLLAYGRAVADVLDGGVSEIDYCARQRALPPAQLNPPPLITGDDLRTMGLPAGPEFRRILEAVRDAQLERRVASKQQALTLAQQLYEQECH
jgi:hypothetical protein